MDWTNEVLRNSVLCLMLFIFALIGERANAFGLFLRWLLVIAGFLIAAIPFDSEYSASWFPLYICGVVLGYWLRGRDDQFYVDFFNNARKQAVDEQIKACLAATGGSCDVRPPIALDKSEVLAAANQPENLVLAEMRQDEMYKGQLRQAIAGRIESLNLSRNGQDAENDTDLKRDN